jgi:hypothetical protein
MNLGAKHVAQAIAPTALSKLMKKVKAAMKNTTDLDVLNHHVSALLIAADRRELGDDDSDDESDMESDIGDSLGIALALAKQVHSAPLLFECLLMSSADQGVDSG